MINEIALSMMLLTNRSEISELSKLIEKPIILQTSGDYFEAREKKKEIERKKEEEIRQKKLKEEEETRKHREKERKKKKVLEKKKKERESNSKSNKSKNSKRKGKRVEIIVSHYCSCERCNGKWTGYPTKSGKPYTVGKTIAVPEDLLGKKMYIEGYGMRECQDTGDSRHIRWIRKGEKVKIDMYVGSHSEVVRRGIVETYGYIY